jgi:hypothetical protein
MDNPKELQAKIEQLRKEIKDINADPRYDRNQVNIFLNSISDISKKQSEIFVLASQLAEISTRRIVRLTWALVILSIALLFFTAWLVIFPKN